MAARDQSCAADGDAPDGDAPDGDAADGADDVGAAGAPDGDAPDGDAADGDAAAGAPDNGAAAGAPDNGAAAGAPDNGAAAGAAGEYRPRLGPGSPEAAEPPEFRGQLYRSQKILLAAMLAAEELPLAAEELPPPNPVHALYIPTRATLAAPFSFGKTALLIAMVCARRGVPQRRLPWNARAGAYSFMRHEAPNARVGIYSFLRYEVVLPVTVIRVAPSIVRQWEEALAKFSHLRWLTIGGCRALAQFRRQLEAGAALPPVVLLQGGTIRASGAARGARGPATAPLVTEFAEALDGRAVSRYVVDDCDMVHIHPAEPAVPAMFTWLVSATRRAGAQGRLLAPKEFVGDSPPGEYLSSIAEVFLGAGCNELRPFRAVRREPPYLVYACDEEFVRAERALGGVQARTIMLQLRDALARNQERMMDLMLRADDENLAEQYASGDAAAVGPAATLAEALANVARRIALRRAAAEAALTLYTWGIRMLEAARAGAGDVGRRPREGARLDRPARHTAADYIAALIAGETFPLGNLNHILILFRASATRAKTQLQESLVADAKISEALAGEDCGCCTLPLDSVVFLMVGCCAIPLCADCVAMEVPVLRQGVCPACQAENAIGRALCVRRATADTADRGAALTAQNARDLLRTIQANAGAAGAAGAADDADDADDAGAADAADAGAAGNAGAGAAGEDAEEAAREDAEEANPTALAETTYSLQLKLRLQTLLAILQGAPLPEEALERPLDISPAGCIGGQAALPRRGAADRKYLIFTMHTTSARAICQYLAAQGVQAARLAGSRAQKDRAVASLSERGVRALIIATPAECGGLHLPMVDEIISFHWANDASNVFAQIMGRALRMGRETSLTFTVLRGVGGG